MLSSIYNSITFATSLMDYCYSYINCSIEYNIYFERLEHYNGVYANVCCYYWYIDTDYYYHELNL